MRSYIERAKDFIAEFAPYLEEVFARGDELCVDDAIDGFNYAYNRKVFYRQGISRIVFVTSDYVVKIDKDLDSGFGSSVDEVNLYAQACHDGYSHLFAEITEFVYHGFAYYIMPRVKRIGGNRGHWERGLTHEEESYINRHTRDIHSQNYGYIDGKLQIFDYAAQ